jgi:transcriptional regulator with XRE-family HTH domain
MSLSPVIARNARAIRAANKLWQADVAAKAGVSRAQNGLIESGDRRLSKEDILGIRLGLFVLLEAPKKGDQAALRT